MTITNINRYCLIYYLDKFRDHMASDSKNIFKNVLNLICILMTMMEWFEI